MSKPAHAIEGWTPHACFDCSDTDGTLIKCRRCGMTIHEANCRAVIGHGIICGDRQLNLHGRCAFVSLLPQVPESRSSNIDWESVHAVAIPVLPNGGFQPMTPCPPFPTNLIIVTSLEGRYVADAPTNYLDFTAQEKLVIGRIGPNRQALHNDLDQMGRRVNIDLFRAIVVVRPLLGDDPGHMGLSVYHYIPGPSEY